MSFSEQADLKGLIIETRQLESPESNSSKPNDQELEPQQRDIEETSPATIENTWTIKPFSWYNLLTHCHLEVTHDQIRASKKPWLFLHHQRHKARELSDLLEPLLSPGTMTPLQKRTSEYFKRCSRTAGNIYNIDNGDSETPDIDVIEAYFALFNQYFFFLSMSDCDVPPIKLVPNVENEFHGQCIDTTIYNARDPWSVTSKEIAIAIQISQNQDRKTRLTFYLSTLLRQMINAFLALHSCRQNGCNYKFENLGLRAHGDAWQSIANVVERQAREIFELDVDLDREFAYAWEIAGGSSIKASLLVAYWGFDEKELARKVRCCRYSQTNAFVGKKGCAVHIPSYALERSQTL